MYSLCINCRFSRTFYPFKPPDKEAASESSIICTDERSIPSYIKTTRPLWMYTVIMSKTSICERWEESE